jgi:hypothetical protein
MNRTFLPVALVCIGLLSGCARPAQRQPVAQAESLPPAYPRTSITDPATQQGVKALEAAVNAMKGSDGQPLYAGVEILPPTRTVLPYGVGRYQQQTRLPVILTTGPVWAKLDTTRREALVRQTHQECLQALERSACKLPLTLTVQEPRGWQVAWLNDPEPGRSTFVGDADE